MEEGGYLFEVNNGRTTARSCSPSLTVSSSFREGGGGGGSKGLSRRRSMKPSIDADNEFITLLHGSDPVKIELNRLENDVRGIISFSICLFYKLDFKFCVDILILQVTLTCMSVISWVYKHLTFFAV